MVWHCSGSVTHRPSGQVTMGGLHMGLHGCVMEMHVLLHTYCPAGHMVPHCCAAGMQVPLHRYWPVGHMGAH